MKRFLLLTLLPMLALAAGPAPYPVAVNSQSPVVTSLQSYQANERTFRVTYKDGTNAVDLTGYTPRMTWATTNTATNVATSSWSYVNSSTSGVVDFTFTPASMNTNGTFIYEVGVNGLPFVYRQGVFTIISSPQGNGAAALTFTNPASYVATVGSQVSGIGFNQATGAAVLTGSVASASGAITGNQDNAILGGLTVSNALTVGGAINANDNIEVAASKHVRFLDGNGTNRITLDGVSGRLIISGAVDIVTTKLNPLTIDGSIAATGSPVYSESDPIWTSASNSYAMQIASKLSTNSIRAGGLGGVLITNAGGLVYISATNVGGGSGTLTGIVVGAGSSTRLTATNDGTANATLNFDANGLATGTPLYVETDPVWTASSNLYYLKTQVDSRFATGTPLYVQSETNANARLSSNVWAVANSTTNYLPMTGGTMYGTLRFGSYGTMSSDETQETLNISNTLTGASIILDNDGSVSFSTIAAYFTGIVETTASGQFTGNAAGLTNLNLASYAGSGLTWTNSQLVSTAGGEGAAQTPATNNWSLAGYSISNIGHTIHFTNGASISLVPGGVSTNDIPGTNSIIVVAEGDDGAFMSGTYIWTNPAAVGDDNMDATYQYFHADDVASNPANYRVVHNLYFDGNWVLSQAGIVHYSSANVPAYEDPSSASWTHYESAITNVVITFSEGSSVTNYAPPSLTVFDTIGAPRISIYSTSTIIYAAASNGATISLDADSTIRISTDNGVHFGVTNGLWINGQRGTNDVIDTLISDGAGGFATATVTYTEGILTGVTRP